MRKKNLFLNTISSLSYEIIAFICGFILPKAILLYYGSEVNGLVSSITQFLSFITLMDLGVGAVVKSTLYKPLAEKNNEEINKILTSAQRFFSRVAFLFVIYVIGLTFIYPLSIGDFGYGYVATLILAIAINTFAQYYFGMVNRLLLEADQKIYIPTMIKSAAYIINTISCIIFIMMGAGIQLVKLNTSIVFLLQPLLMAIYVKKHYNINKHIKLTEEPIKQKWNGFAQHVAAYILGATDTVVLTLLSTLKNVSIYSVYFMVISAVKTFTMALTNGMQSLLGNMLARKEDKLMNDTFSAYETIMHCIATFAFGCTAILIAPFVSVYTKEINDANYNAPLFGYLLSFAYMAYCYRLPYNTMVLAAGHYKQTQNSAWIEMIINIVISVLTVIKFGLIGVAVGTLIAMLYRSIYLAWYLSRNILNRPLKHFVKHMLINCITLAIMIYLTHWFTITEYTYVSWVLFALKVAPISLLVCGIINFIFYKDELKQIKTMLIK